MESAKLAEPAYIKFRSAVSFWPGLLRDAQVPCCAPWSCEDAWKFYIFLWFLKGFRMHRAKLKPQTNQRKYLSNVFNTVHGNSGSWYVTVANGFWWFSSNHKIFGLASRVPLARTVPHQGWALEMQGIPMFFLRWSRWFRRGAKVASIHP